MAQREGRHISVPFYRLNIVDEYNNGMGDMDQADQLCLQYLVHYWLRNQKWWFSIFMCIMEYSLTNCYVLYCKFFEIHGRKIPLTHYEFMKAIVLAWMKPSQYWPKEKWKSDGELLVSSFIGVSTSVITKRSEISPTWSTTFTDNTLNPYSGSLRCQLNQTRNHLPILNPKKESQCQMHWWMYKVKYRKQLMICSLCNVILCIECYEPYHEISNLTKLKEV